MMPGGWTCTVTGQPTLPSLPSPVGVAWISQKSLVLPSGGCRVWLQLYSHGCMTVSSPPRTYQLRMQSISHNPVWTLTIGIYRSWKWAQT